MKPYLKGVAVQATAIILAALGAALITFIQSIVSKTGLCPEIPTSPTEAGLLGGILKTVHTAFISSKNIS